MARAHASCSIASVTALAISVCAGAATVNIPPETLPAEAFFVSSPASTVNIWDEGGILPGEMFNPFDFHGSTINVASGGEFGWFTITGFADNCNVNINGGTLIRTTFVGLTGSTTININSGTVRNRVHLQGNARINVNGGFIGLVAQGQPSMVLDDNAVAVIDGGEVDDIVDVNDNAALTLRSGSIGTGLKGAGSSTINIEGGTTDRNGWIVSEDATLNVSGGTIGRDFLIQNGTVNMTGGAFEQNAGMVNSSGVDPTFNMKGGVLGPTFRCYDGTLNMAGGATGSFRLGRPTGDGSGATLNLYVKSLTIDGVYVPLAANVPTLIADRGEKLLVAELANGDAFTLTIRSSGNGAEDYARPGALLNAIHHCPTDFDDSGSTDITDLLTLLADFNDTDDGDTDNDGDTDVTDLLNLLSMFNESCSLPF